MALGDVLRVEWAPTRDPLDDIPTNSTDWVDITDRLASGTTKSGWGNVFDLFAASEATLVFRNGNRSQSQLLNPSNWYRWLQVRIVAPHASGVAPTWGIFHGHIKTVRHNQQQAPFQANVTITCVDRFGISGEVEMPGDDPDAAENIESWFSMVTNTAVARDGTFGFYWPAEGVLTGIGGPWGMAEFICMLAGLSSPTRVSDAPVPAFFPADLTGNGLQVLQDYLEAERARICTDPLSGEVLYLGRWTQIQAAADGAQWTFSDTPATGEYRATRQDFDLAEPGTDHYTKAIFGDVFNPPSTADNTPAGYPPSTLSRANVPLADRNWAKANADMVVAVHSGIDTFPERIRVLTWAGNDTVPADHPAMARIGRDAIGVEFTPVGGSQMSWLTLAEGKDHVFDQNAWFTTFRLSNLNRWIDAYGTDGLFILGTSSWGGPEIFAP